MAFRSTPPLPSAQGILLVVYADTVYNADLTSFRPLNRIERLRRQAKRADNAKKRAARERKARENGETLEDADAAAAASQALAGADASAAPAAGDAGTKTAANAAATASAWSCEFCKFTDSTFDAVVEHEKSCPSNPEVVAAAKAKADVAAAKAATESKAKAEALAAATAAAAALKAAAAAAAAAAEMDDTSSDESDDDADDADGQSRDAATKEDAAITRNQGKATTRGDSHADGGSGGGGRLSAEVIESLAVLQNTVTVLADQLKLVNEDLKAAQTEIGVFRLQASRRRSQVSTTLHLLSAMHHSMVQLAMHAM